ncbi:helix-turn-helix domain-containing protein [Ruminococcus sp.]
MSSGIQINPHKLTEARLSRAYNISKLAELVGVTRQAISKYEQGLSNMSPEVLNKISTVLEFPVSFFYKADNNTNNSQSTVFYRSFKSSEESIRSMIRVKCNWTYIVYSYLNSRVTMPKVNLPNLDLLLNQGELSLDTIQNIANVVRDYWCIGNGPIQNLIYILEKNGIIVSGGSIKATKTDACSEVIAGTPVIFYDKTQKSACRIRFSIAHELGHILLHSYVTNEDLKNKEFLEKVEKEANTFAACFLLPKNSFIRDVNSTSLEYFIMLKEKWKVSISALVYRCRELSLIDETQHLSLRKKISYKGWNKKEPLDNIIAYDKPQLFKQAVEFILENSNTKKSDIVYYFSFNTKDLSDIFGCNEKFWDDTNTPIKFSMIN